MFVSVKKNATSKNLSSHFYEKFEKSRFFIRRDRKVVRKIGEFEKPKFEKSGVIYKSFIREIQGTSEKVRKNGEFE